MDEGELSPLYLAPRAHEPRGSVIGVQVLGALVLIVVGARYFVSSVEHLSYMWGIPAFVLSLIITPIATELPEKFNSVIWIRQGKDTLALGNITGAMVFQSSIIPAIGILLTPWELEPLAKVSARPGPARGGSTLNVGPLPRKNQTRTTTGRRPFLPSIPNSGIPSPLTTATGERFLCRIKNTHVIPMVLHFT